MMNNDHEWDHNEGNPHGLAEIAYKRWLNPFSVGNDAFITVSGREEWSPVPGEDGEPRVALRRILVITVSNGIDKVGVELHSSRDGDSVCSQYTNILHGLSEGLYKAAHFLEPLVNGYPDGIGLNQDGSIQEGSSWEDTLRRPGITPFDLNDLVGQRMRARIANIEKKEEDDTEPPPGQYL
jgi:hypothetical protein